MPSRAAGKLFSNFMGLSLIQGANLLLSFLVLPYLIIRIGADRFGVIAIAQMVMTWLCTVADYGFNLTATRSIALEKEDPEKISRIFSTTLSAKILITLILLAGLLVPWIIFRSYGHNFLLYLFAFAFVAGQSLFVNWFFQGIEKMQYIAVSTLVGRLIFVVLVFIFINKREDDVYYLLFFGIGNIIAGLLSIILAVKFFNIKLRIPERSDIIREFKDGWQITVSSLTVNSYFYSNIFILRVFTNDLTVGYYSIAEKILFAVRQIISLFSQVVYPHICRLVHRNRQESNNFFIKVYRPFLWVIITGCCVLFIFSPQIIKLFIGNESLVPVLLLRLLSFVPLIVYLNIPPGQLLLAFDHKKSYVHIITLGTAVNLVVNIFLAKYWGAAGTALSIVITELFITTGLYMKLYSKNLSGYINGVK
jgi:PST family polysaccharide transporter